MRRHYVVTSRSSERLEYDNLQGAIDRAKRICTLEDDIVIIFAVTKTEFFHETVEVIRYKYIRDFGIVENMG